MPTIWWGRQRAGAQATLMPAAVHLRFQADAWFAAHVERTNAFGAVSFVREKDIRSTLSFERSIGILPVACAASTWKITPFSRQISPSSAMGWMTPNLVVDRHHRGQHGVRTQGLLELFGS
jgi:hypothetical protein